MTHVRLYRDAAELRGRDLFACSLAQWRFLQELARAFGWTSAGATYELDPKLKIASPARHDYEPGPASDRKLVDAEDALSFARALEQAMNSGRLPSIIEAQGATLLLGGNTVTSVTDFAAEFIQYAYGGAFMFSREEE